MAFFNPFGWFSRNAFAETVDPSPDRGNYRFFVPPDSRHYLGPWTRLAVNQKAEWIWQNFGIVKEGISGIARHTVGKGISLQLDSEDSEWNRLGEQDFENYALTPERCDLAGRRNFYETQTHAIEQRLIRGEFFCALADNPEWDNAPCFHIYDSEEIASPYPVPPEFDPNLTIDGVTVDKNARATLYWVRDIVGNFSPIPRGQMLHWYKPHSVNQPRGISDFAQAVNPMVDIYELKKLATRSAKAQQLLALALKGVDKKKRKGAFGAIENAGIKTDGSPDHDSLQMEKMMGSAGGGIIYLDDKDGDAKLITADSPSPLVETFVTDLLMRDVCAGWGVPSEFFWNIAKLNGGNTRFILERANLFFSILADRLCDRFSTPIAFRYLSHRVTTGKLPKCKDPNWGMKLVWQLPARMNIDNGRENRILLELLANGLITQRQYCDERGLNYRAVQLQWLREPKEFIQKAIDLGIDPEYLQRLKDNLPLWRAPAPGTVNAAGTDQGQTQTDQGTGGGNAEMPDQIFNIDVHNGGRKTFEFRRADGSLVTGSIGDSEDDRS